jgi:hypothetical protein
MCQIAVIAIPCGLDRMFSKECFVQGMIEDLKDECEKCGKIVDMRVPRPDVGVDASAVLGKGCYGKVYVLMDMPESARRLRDVIDGRVYDGRPLRVAYIQPAHFYMLPITVAR